MPLGQSQNPHLHTFIVLYILFIHLYKHLIFFLDLSFWKSSARKIYAVTREDLEAGQSSARVNTIGT